MRNFLILIISFISFNCYASTILIATSTGNIGRGIAKFLAQENHNLILAGRNNDKLEELQKSLKKEYPKLSVSYINYDYNDFESIKKAVSALSDDSLEGVIIIPPRPMLS